MAQKPPKGSVGSVAIFLDIFKIQFGIILGYSGIIPGSRGRAQGRLPWLCHLLSCPSSSQPPSSSSSPLLPPGNTFPPSDSWHNPSFVPSQTPSRLTRRAPHTPQRQGQTLQHHQVSTMEENLTLKMFQNQHPHALHFFLYAAGKMRVEKTISEQKTNRVKRQHGYKTLISLLAQVLWYYLIYCQSTSAKITWETVSQALKLILARCLQDVGWVELPLSSFHPLSCQYWGLVSFPQSLPELCSCADILGPTALIEPLPPVKFGAEKDLSAFSAGK